jgi:O-antigen/teichoic acid export membrane protein
VRRLGAGRRAPPRPGGAADDRPASLASSASLLLGTQIVGNAGYFVAVLLLARGLGPTDRGQVAFITVTAMVTARCANLGLNEAVRVLAAQRPADRPALLGNLLLAVTVLAIAAALLVTGALAALPGVRPPGIDGPQLVILGLATLATALVAAGYAYLQGCSRFGPYGLIQATGPWLYAVLLAAAWAGPGLTATRAAAIWVGAQALPAMVMVSACARGIGIGAPRAALLRESIRFGVRAWAGGFAHFLNARTDQILIALIASEATLGVYAVAVNASEILFYLPTAVAAALLPAVAREEARDRAAQRTLAIFRAVTLVTGAAILLAAILGPVLIPLVFGDPYRGAVDPFLWLLPSALGFAASATFSSALVASGAPGLSSLGPAVSLVLGIALDLVLIPAYGASGAAAASSAALLAGGAAAASAYRSRSGFAWSALLPRAGDVRTLRLLARRARRARAATA